MSLCTEPVPVSPPAPLDDQSGLSEIERVNRVAVGYTGDDGFVPERRSCFKFPSSPPARARCMSLPLSVSDLSHLDKKIGDTQTA